jgi:hypothetical protein
MVDSKIDALRTKARAMIGAGTLPSTSEPSSVLGSYVSSAKKCTLCGELIPTKGFQYEVRAPGPGTSNVHYHLHFLCHAAWQIEVDASEQD